MRVLCARSILLLLVFCPFLKFFHSSSFRFATWRTTGRGELFRKKYLRSYYNTLATLPWTDRDQCGSSSHSWCRRHS